MQTNDQSSIPHGDKGPHGRYLTGMCYVGRDHLIFDPNEVQDLRNVRNNAIEPAIIVFAGDDQGVLSAQNSFLGDQWFLTLERLHASLDPEMERWREEVCRGGGEQLLEPSTTGNNKWDWTCGALADINSEDTCRWEDLVLMAWCLRQYNTLASPF